MPEFLQPHGSAILALGWLGALYLAQLLAADVVGIRRGHTPGSPIAGGHDDLLFRAARAHANTTESIGAVILIAAFAMLRGGDPAWVSGGLWLFLACRVAHTLFYYLDWRLPRSAAFVTGVLALVALFLVGLRGPTG